MPWSKVMDTVKKTKAPVVVKQQDKRVTVALPPTDAHPAKTVTVNHVGPKLNAPKFSDELDHPSQVTPLHESKIEKEFKHEPKPDPISNPTRDNSSAAENVVGEKK